MNDSPCIGRLEHHIHEIFMSNRVPGEEFVYISSPELFNALEDYCDDQGMNEPKPPLLIIGDAGSGKSALLANWLQRRQRNTARVRNTDEFIFWHAVGCSRQSTDVNSLMRRLMTDLKSRFELSREVSQSQERLSWDLPHFLELASKRGKVIIVIDGLHSLDSNDGDAGLSWLPLEFPPNVRVVLSATVSEAPVMDNPEIQLVDILPKKPRILTELERRHWQVLKLRLLEKPQIRNIVESFLKKSLQVESTVLSSDPFLTSIEDDSAEESLQDRHLKGFLLFDTQIEQILCHSMASLPFFLRLLLRSLGWSASRGYDVWVLLEDWLRAKNSLDLLLRILQTLENGFQVTEARKKTSEELCVDSGGLAALRISYTWHPYFQKESSLNFLGLEEGEDPAQYSLENQRLKRQGVMSSKPATYGRPDGKLNSNAIAATRSTSTGIVAMDDAKWNNAADFADKRLHDARFEAQRDMSSLIERAKYDAKKSGDRMSFIDLILSTNSKVDSSDTNNNNNSSNNSSSIGSAGLRSGRANSFRHINSASLNSPLPPSAGNTNNTNNSGGTGGNSGGNYDVFVFDDIDESKLDEDRVSSSGSTNAINMNSSNINTGGHPAIKASLTGNSMLLTHDENFDDEDMIIYDENMNHTIIDPNAGLDTIPIHLRGGTGSKGFGPLLGQALSLLLVARHGLTESELWFLLSSMQYPDEQSMEKTQFESEMRALISVCYSYREHFTDIWRTADTHLTGKLDRNQLLKGMRKINPEFTREDLTSLLKYVRVFDENKIEYQDLVKRIVRAEKNYRMNLLQAGKRKSGSVSALNGNNSFQDDEDAAESSYLDEGGDGSLNGGASQSSLGAVMEEALLSALCAIGVVYSPDNQVLVLPLESVVLRQVVMDRYIGASGAESWHRRLIRYFQTQNNSLRRSEELPWHLQICRKWHSLKDTLVDLSTFEMMFDGDLRDELLEYWRLLTEGVLWISNEAQMEATSSRLQISDNARIITDIDAAASMGLTEKESKKYTLRNQVATFDIVEEYNRSVERWAASPNATIAKLSSILALISQFLVAYSRRPEHHPPPFIRLAVDMDALEQFGVTYSKFGGVTMLTDALSLGGSISKKRDKPLLGNLANISRQDSQLYPYLRWLWIQFPWMALPRVTSLKSDSSMGTTSRLEEMTENGITSQGSFYTAPSRSKTASDMLRKEYKHSRRFWAVKKNDPSLGAVITTTDHRVKAVSKGVQLSTSLTISAMNSIAKANTEASVIRISASKFRRALKEDSESLGDLPHSMPSIRSLNSQSRFPTVGKHFREKVFQEVEAKDHFSQTASERFGGQLPIIDLEERIKRINDLEVVHDMNIKQSNAIPVAENDLLYQMELDRLGRLRQVYDRLHEDYVNRKKNKGELQEKILKRSEIDERVTASLMMGEMAITGLETRHQSLMDALDDAKLLNASYTKLIGFLDANPPYTQLHIAAVEQELVLVRSQLEDLREFRISIYADMERLNSLHELEFQPRVQEVRDRRKIVQQKLKKQKQINADLQSKLTQLFGSKPGKRSSIHENSTDYRLGSPNGDSKRARSPKGSIITESNKNNSPSGKHPSPQRGAGGRSSMSSIESSLILDPNDFNPTDDDKNRDNAAFETLLQRTGVGSAEEFLHRYRSAQRLHDSLRSHQNLSESRLSNLRNEFSELSATWSQAQLVSKSDEPLEVNSDAEKEVRYLDQKLFKLEMRSGQLLRQTEKAMLSINEIRSGVMHMASLIQAKDYLLHKLPGNSAPPECNVDEDITKVLSWCEERVIAINEALVLDSSKPTATDDSLPFNARQAQLAQLVFNNMKKTGSSESRPRSQRTHAVKKKMVGGMAQSLIMNASDTEALEGLTGVRVLAKDTSEKQYESQVENEQKGREDVVAQKDLKAYGKIGDDSIEELQSYLSKALVSDTTKNALRRANHIEGKRIGRGAGFGWALDEFLGQQGEHASGASARGKRHRTHRNDTTKVLDRAEIKALKSPVKKAADSLVANSEVIGTEAS